MKLSSLTNDESKKHNSLKDDQQPCNAINCFRKATESINVDAGKFGTISLLLCKSCLTIFDIKNEKLNQSDCFGSPTKEQSD